MNVQTGDRVQITNNFYTRPYYGLTGEIKKVTESPSGALIFCTIKLDGSNKKIHACADHVKVISRQADFFNQKQVA